MAAPSVLIVGAGAIGAFFGSALARQGAGVCVVCRSDFDVVSRDGYDIRSALLGDHRFHPQRVLREVSDYGGAPDYLILAVKVLQDFDRVALIKPAVAAHTVIVLIQNGIDIEEEIAAAFPSNELLSSLAFIGVGRTAPGAIHHQSAGSLILGRYPKGITTAAEKLAGMFEANGIGCKLTDNVISARWQKAVWNAVFNPVSIFGAVLDTATMLGSAEARDFVRRAMQEVCDAAAANGHPQHPKLIEQMILGTHSMPAYKTSMALDYESNRPMEIEAILGNVVRAARKAGAAVPILETIYAIAKMVEAKARQ